MTDRDTRMASDKAHAVDPSRRVTIYFDGKAIEAFAGETVAAALFAAGRRIFTRSFKYHRPRGLLCCSGDCPNCMMRIDGKPNMRACLVPVRDGLRVSGQHAWPSLDQDWLHIIEMFDWLMPAGFYYKTFYRPRLLWRVAEPIIRRLAGLGKVEMLDSDLEGFEHRHDFTDVAVVGGGPAGIHAAAEAAARGASVTLIEREPRLGGHLRYSSGKYDYKEYSRLRGYEIAQKMESVVLGQPRIYVLQDATAIGSYEGGLLPVLQAKTLVHLRTRSLIIASGCHEYPLVFQNNDLPGVMLGRAALRMINLFGIRPGRRAVVITANDHGYALAEECLQAGIDVAEVVEARPTPSECEQAPTLREHGVRVSLGMTIRAAIGRKRVKGARLGPVDLQGKPAPGPERPVDCDLILISVGWQPAAALLYQAGCELKFESQLGQAVPQKLVPGVFAAGEVLGLPDLQSIIHSGHIAGANAAASATSSEVRYGDDEMERLLAKARKGTPAFTISNATGKRKNFVCLCEDVVEKDLRQAVFEGFDEIETLKRYSTVSMGPCQGRMCGRASAEIYVLATGKDLASIGATTSRPPLFPTPLGALAGGEFHPVKLTSLHYKHAALTTDFMDMSVWKRPLIYSSVREEYQAVRHRVGLIDVSTLGKIIVKGRDAARLLDKVYTHSFSTLKPGRIRYGVICDESGIILDDGTVARLASDYYYVTTTTGNVDFVEQWLKWWAAGTGWCVHVINVTSANAAVNLAGPNARDVLTGLTEIDVSATAFPYLACREANVAAVPALLLRIGFVGETGWEIHFPAEFGEYLWDRLLEAGKCFGIRPFGVETQRLLRLEKKHVIVGQDTDSLSNPFEAEMGWVVKLDKADFIGRYALESLKSQPLRNRLVGFQMSCAEPPLDGNAVAIGGALVGRVSSVRYSPLLGHYVGMAWVPEEHAREGTEIQVYVNGKTYPAEILIKPFYDPEGLKQK